MIPTDSWQPADGLVLEPNASRSATECSKSLALTAGPGAGKTEMLAQRADFLLRTGKCRYPKRILAISFKVDASRNLKERVKRRCGAELASRFDSYTFHAFAKRIIDRFRPVLTGHDRLEPGYTIGEPRVTGKQIGFGDMVSLAIQILLDSEIARNALRQTYSDVFLDEFQDCTNVQYDLVKKGFQNTGIRLTAVGDTKQKIMSWAGALEGIFLTFAQDFAADQLNLYRNFRSKPELLRMQNEIIRTLDPDSVMPDDQISGEGGEIYICSFSDDQEEAESLVEQISSWIQDDNVPFSEIAILVSKQIDLYAAPLMKELERNSIPYRNEHTMQDIIVEPAARLVVDYLLCLYGKREPEAWRRLMELLIPFSDDEEGQDVLYSDWQSFIHSERKESLKDTSDLSFPKRWEFVNRFLKKVGKPILTALSHDYEAKARLKEVFKETGKRVNELLAHEPELTKALARFSDDQAVRILTVHKSKGLEFSNVIFLAVEDQTFWGKADEERSAYFVGVSRAKDKLLLTHVDRRPRHSGHSGIWNISRTPHEEFLGYAEAVLT
ncbi:UvrD/REP helicase [Candidatus Magnetomorum sp. HK-1]|nr:UvrD/REP helicase [Candidatus Magnetomorum sp. HK-1]